MQPPMTCRTRTLLFAALASLALATPAAAQGGLQLRPGESVAPPPVVRMAQRAVSASDAKRIALRHVGGGEVVDISRAGSTYRVRVVTRGGRVRDVRVDARSGRVVG